MVACFTLVCFSCNEDDLIDSPNASIEDPAEGTLDVISDETVDFLESLDLQLEEAEMSTITYPDHSSEDAYLVEGDIAITKDQYRQMVKDSRNPNKRQYRSNNLVNSPRTINIIGFTGNSSSGLTSRMRTALQWAVNNYNALNTGLSFNLTYGTNYQPRDMVVYRVANGRAGGQAGFPSGGRPYKFVQIFSGMDGYDTNTIEHVITHEIGHSVGLRHTDWFSRQSCRQSGEQANPPGAIRIPGTPSGFDANSIMLACFGSGEDGEFGFYDRVALEYLY